jgi:hypothetical protein
MARHRRKFKHPPQVAKIRRPGRRHRTNMRAAVVIQASREHVAPSPAPPTSLIRFRSAPLGAEEQRLLAELRAAVSAEHPTSPPIAVLVPVLGRPHRVGELLGSFRSATSPADARLYFIAQVSDVEEVAAIRAHGFNPILVGDEDRSWGRKINRGFERTGESWLLLGADDLRFHAGWVERVRHLLKAHMGVIGTNDLGNPSTMTGTSSTHSLVRRSYARICGTADERNKVLHEGYDHNFPDSELVVTARRRGMYVHCVRCVVEHMHPAWGKGHMDTVYARGQQTYHQDSALFAHRRRVFGW